MTGESNNLLVSLIKSLIEWEKDFRSMANDPEYVMRRLNVFLVRNGKLKPSMNIREFILQLKGHSIYELGFEIEDEYKNIRIINSDGYIDSDIKIWYENSIRNDDVDQNLIKDFLQECRKEYEETGNSEILEMYSEVRAFINPSNYCIPTNSIMSLVGKYSNISETIIKIQEWYEDVKLLSKENYICPVCGRILDNNIFKEYRCTDMCMYFRGKESLEPKKLNIDSELKYKKLKRGIYTYTLLPGVSELRIYQELVSKYGYKKVALYPDIDKFDISVAFDTGAIYVDVKDFTSPYNLVDTIINNKSFIKMERISDNDYVFLVIPEHRQNIYRSGDYTKIVKNRLDKLMNKVCVVHEGEFHEKVGDIINELY